MTSNVSIVVPVKVNFSDVYRSTVLLSRRVYRKILWIWGIVAALWFGLLTLSYLRTGPEADWQQTLHGSNKLIWVLLIPVLLVCVIPVFGSTKIIRNESVKIGFNYQFSDDGINVETSLARSDVKWAAIRELIETRSAFLLLWSPTTAYIVPLRCFSSESDVLAARELFRSKVPKTKLRAR